MNGKVETSNNNQCSGGDRALLLLLLLVGVELGPEHHAPLHPEVGPVQHLLPQRHLLPAGVHPAGRPPRLLPCSATVRITRMCSVHGQQTVPWIFYRISKQCAVPQFVL